VKDPSLFRGLGKPFCCNCDKERIDLASQHHSVDDLVLLTCNDYKCKQNDGTVYNYINDKTFYYYPFFIKNISNY